MATSSCRQKLARADQHIEVLHRELEAFTQGDIYAVRMEKHAERAEKRLVCRWVIDRLEPVPEHWSVIIGDLVHNLRSALDHAIWDLIVTQHREQFAEANRPRISFPILQDRERFLEQFVVRHLGSAERAAVERAQPYLVTPSDPRRDALAALHELWNTDKHRRIVVVHLAAAEAEIRTRPALPENTLTIAQGTLEEGTEVARFSAPCELAEAQVKVDADIALEVGIKPGPRLPGVPLQLGVDELRRRVSRALSDLGV